MTATDASALAASATAAPLPATKAARWGAWMLAVSPAYFVLACLTNGGLRPPRPARCETSVMGVSQKA